MWIATIRAAIALPTVVFGMWLLAKIVGPIVNFATSGPNSDAASVTRVGGYFNALTVDNLVLVGAIGVGLYLLTRAAVESRLG